MIRIIPPELDTTEATDGALAALLVITQEPAQESGEPLTIRLELAWRQLVRRPFAAKAREDVPV